MKKKLTYREQLLELAKIYDVKEVQEYIKRRKNLTSGQIELILRKNKITIPRDFKTNFFKENVSKPLFKVSKKIDELKEESTKIVNKFSRKVSYFKEDSSRSISRLFLNLWRSMGKTGLGFLNMMPKLGETYYNFFSSFFTNLFHGIYNQQINRNKSGKVIIIFFAVIGVSTIVVTSINTFLNTEKTEQVQVVKKEKN